MNDVVCMNHQTSYFVLIKVNFGAPMHFSYGRRGPFFKLLLQGTSSGRYYHHF